MNMKKRYIGAAAAALALILAGCAAPSGGDASPSEPGGAQELETDVVRYGTFSTGNSSIEVLVGMDTGAFSDVGIDVEQQNVATTAALVPLLASNQVDLAYLSYPVALSALAAGVDISLAGATQNLAPGVQALYVSSDSDITELEGLEGKRIGLNAVGGYGDVLLGEALATVGMTLDDVELVEVQFSNTITALEAGEIDAGWLSTPFIARAKADPNKLARELVDFNDIPSLTDLPQGGSVVTGSFLRDAPVTLRTFMKAMQEVGDSLSADPDFQRERTAAIADYPPAVAEVVALSEYQGTVSIDKLMRVVDLQQKYGQLSGEVDIEAFAAAQIQ